MAAKQSIICWWTVCYFAIIDTNASLRDFLGNLAMGNLGTENLIIGKVLLHVKIEYKNTSPLIHIIHTHKNSLCLHTAKCMAKWSLCFSGRKERTPFRAISREWKESPKFKIKPKHPEKVLWFINRIPLSPEMLPCDAWSKMCYC